MVCEIKPHDLDKFVELYSPGLLKLSKQNYNNYITEKLIAKKRKEEEYARIAKKKEIAENGKCKEVATGKSTDGSIDITCRVIVEADKECMKLPYDPQYIVHLSGSSFHRNKQICKDPKEKNTKDK